MYCIGIGGIGMSALARYFYARGTAVAGYDLTRTDLTIELEKMGIPIHYNERVDLLPADVDLVMYTPAIPADHLELKYYQNTSVPVLKRSEVLQLVTENVFTIAVAGTHGKTTVSTMIAHLLKESGYDCTAFLGGISINYNTNYIAGRTDVMVVEADEYDRSFLKLSPDIAVITAIDNDHLDVYGNRQALVDSFISFTKTLKPGGSLVIRHDLYELIHDVEQDIITYSITDEHATSTARQIEMKGGTIDFVWSNATKQHETDLRMNYPGWHNIENALAAVSVATLLNIPANEIHKAIASFKGIKRRFEIIFQSPGFVMIDDYAHHPNELSALLNSVRKMYPGRKISIVFQPHLYSRTNDFAEEFAHSLDEADEVFLLDIYPAREQPIAGVSSKLILDKMKNRDSQIVAKSQLVDTLKNTNPEILLMAGAGDISDIVIPVKKSLTEL